MERWKGLVVLPMLMVLWAGCTEGEAEPQSVAIQIIDWDGTGQPERISWELTWPVGERPQQVESSEWVAVRVGETEVIPLDVIPGPYPQNIMDSVETYRNHNHCITQLAPGEYEVWAVVQVDGERLRSQTVRLEIAG